MVVGFTPEQSMSTTTKFVSSWRGVLGTTLCGFYLYTASVIKQKNDQNISIALFLPVSIWFKVMVFNATFNNISAISWRPVLLVEETEVPG
jgi:hypothetical protein